MSALVTENNLGPEFDRGNIQPDTIRLKIGAGMTIAPDGTISVGTQTGYSIFPIWAEESGGLTANNRQWSFGNGATGNINIPVPDCEVFAMSFDSEVFGTSADIELMRNDIAVTSEQFSGGDGYNVLATPIAYTEGDTLGFRTDVLSGAYSDARVTAWCRIPLVGLKGDKGDQGDNGIDGIGGAPNACARIAVNSGTINTGILDVSFGTATIDTIGVSISGNLITLPAGVYALNLILNTSSTAQRPNQSINLFSGGSFVSQENGEGYIRSTGGHNNAKITHTDIISTTGGDINYTTSPIANGGNVSLDTGKLIIHKIA